MPFEESNEESMDRPERPQTLLESALKAVFSELDALDEARKRLHRSTEQFQVSEKNEVASGSAEKELSPFGTSPNQAALREIFHRVRSTRHSLNSIADRIEV